MTILLWLLALAIFALLTWLGALPLLVLAILVAAILTPPKGD